MKKCTNVINQNKILYFKIEKKNMIYYRKKIWCNQMEILRNFENFEKIEILAIQSKNYLFSTNHTMISITREVLILYQTFDGIIELILSQLLYFLKYRIAL